MSRSYGNTKKIIRNGLPHIDIAYLNKMGFLRSSFSQVEFKWIGSRNNIFYSVFADIGIGSYSYVRLRYDVHTEYGRRIRELDYSIQLIKTPCHFGGYRFWFKCPLYNGNERCGKRVRKLYASDAMFGCRQCQGIVYPRRSKGLDA